MHSVNQKLFHIFGSIHGVRREVKVQVARVTVLWSIASAVTYHELNLYTNDQRIHE